MRRLRGVTELPPLLDTDELEVGSFYLVKRWNGTVDEKFIANLVEIKEVCKKDIQKNRQEKLERDKNLSKSFKPEEGPPTEEGETKSDSAEKSPREDENPQTYKLFYVHYDGLDRRLDEWIERERFIEHAVPAALCSPAILPTGVENVSVAKAGGTLTRSQKRIHVEFHHHQTSYDDMDATTAKLEKEHEERTKVKNVEMVYLGRFEICTWYFSPFPPSILLGPHQKLFVCEFCLLYTPKKETFQTHVAKCEARQPPGDEIYRKDNITVYEVDGKANRTYCQCLCLLSKLFMDHKTLYFDVDTFLFYVLCETDDRGAHLVGHFSKERYSENNLACIMILPPYQRKGYGKLLIQFSYELSSREGWIGTPEKPLSDLGKVSYRSYWRWRLLQVMDMAKVEDITVSDLSRLSGIATDDIVSTLQTMSIVKYWKGDHVVRTNRRVIEHCIAYNLCKAPRLLLDADRIRWKPAHVRRSPRVCMDS